MIISFRARSTISSVHEFHLFTSVTSTRTQHYISIFFLSPPSAVQCSWNGPVPADWPQRMFCQRSRLKSLPKCPYGYSLLVDMVWAVSAKLHYTDTGYGHVHHHHIRLFEVVQHHHKRTSSQQFYNFLYNKFATSQCQSPTSRHVKILGCGKFLSVGGEFVVQQVVESLWARLLVVLYNTSVAGVRV